jgi:coenzyme PQQ precursor peptide PqqA
MCTTFMRAAAGMKRCGRIERPAAAALPPRAELAVSETKHERNRTMTWSAPKFIEVACGMEINRYAPADGGEPILF